MSRSSATAGASTTARRTSPRPTVSHLLTKQGKLTVTLTVTDDLGHTAQTSDDFFIAGQYPQARFTFSPTTVFAGEPVSFDGSASSDSDGTIASYDWQWGDGAADASTAKPKHTFAGPGTYQVALFVRDDNTQSGAAIHNVEVRKLVVPKVSHATLTNEAFSVGSKATASGSKASVGTTFKFTLAAPAKVKVAFSRQARHAEGRRAHLRYGPNAIPFSGRIGKRPLRAREIHGDADGEQREGQGETGHGRLHDPQVARSAGCNAGAEPDMCGRWIAIPP